MKDTLRQIDRKLKKLNQAIALQKSITKEKELNPRLDLLESGRSYILLEIANRQNPYNAVRSCIPKKKQRQLGMLPDLNK